MHSTWPLVNIPGHSAKVSPTCGKHWGCTWCIQRDVPWLGIPCQIQTAFHYWRLSWTSHTILSNLKKSPLWFSNVSRLTRRALFTWALMQPWRPWKWLWVYGISVMTDTCWKETTFLSLRCESPWLYIILQGKGFSLFPRLPKACQTYYLFASNSLQINQVILFYPLCKFKHLLCER